YRSAIFFHDEAQRVAAEASKQKLEQSGVLKRAIVTEITRLDAFYPAEDYHQDYYKNNSRRYRYYRSGCGRDRRLVEIWGKSSK
ncbi:MAG: peptide-methionine (S)-S-oxide reductase, partial [Nevskiales bacterium]